jgi:glycosyltransferase involved in cell wall biosynthesis
MAKSVSVIIPTYNYARFIGDALGGVFSQTRSPAEIIVVDDGSTDETQDIVRGFGDGVKYIRQENAGVCAARNRGVAESTGELISFLDADDIWEPTKLERQALRFASDDLIGLVHCGMREFDGENDETVRLQIEGAEGHVADKLLLWESPSVNVSGSVVMVSRDAFDAVGGFDTQMKVAEDWDFCYRVARKYKVGFVPEALVNYRSHDAAAHRNVREMERGMSLFYEKAFADPALEHLRRRAYGNFHRVMAGSYFHSGEYGKFLSHSLKSIWMRPRNLAYFVEFPWRYFSRRNPVRNAPSSDKHA